MTFVGGAAPARGGPGPGWPVTGGAAVGIGGDVRGVPPLRRIEQCVLVVHDLLPRAPEEPRGEQQVLRDGGDDVLDRIKRPRPVAAKQYIDAAVPLERRCGERGNVPDRASSPPHPQPLPPPL